MVRKLTEGQRAFWSAVVTIIPVLMLTLAVVFSRRSKWPYLVVLVFAVLLGLVLALLFLLELWGLAALYHDTNDPVAAKWTLALLPWIIVGIGFLTVNDAMLAQLSIRKRASVDDDLHDEAPDDDKG